MTNVLLLREPCEEGVDKYERDFQSAGYRPISVPVLETLLANISLLADVIREGPATRRLNGVVITSKRSCDAWKAALDELESSSPEGVSTSCGEWWSQVPFYVVGEKSATSVRDAFGGDVLAGPAMVDVRGQDSGNAANLANFILTDLGGDGGDEPRCCQRRRLLYLTGDKNRDTIMQALTGSNVELEPVQVYQTQLSSSFHQNLALAIESSSPSSLPHKEPWWIVHFAPSAAASATPALKEHFLIPDQNCYDYDLPSGPNKRLLPARVAAIGPTTRSFLMDTLHQRVDVTAPKPSSEELVAAIVKFDQEREHEVP